MISDTERMLLTAMRKQQADNLHHGNPAIELMAENTLWLLDIIERLEPSSTSELRVAQAGEP